MKFTEAKRTKAPESGNMHVYSVAYVATEKYLACLRHCADALVELRQKQAEYDELIEALAAAQEAMVDSLLEHYEGEPFPSAINYDGTTLLLRVNENGGVEVEPVKTRSYCDLYRVEKPAAPAEAFAGATAQAAA